MHSKETNKFVILATFTSLLIEHRLGQAQPVFLYVERVNKMSERCNQKESRKQVGEVEQNGFTMLDVQIRGLRVEGLRQYLDERAEEMITDPRPFSEYMRMKIKEKGVLQQNVFLAADISENYGYKLIAEEKRTRQRDMILRLCFASGFSAEDTQEALLRYGMAPLWERIPRDVILLVALGNRIHDLEDVNHLLEQYGYLPLIQDYE